MSDSAEHRFEAYGRLLYWLENTSPAELDAVREYAEACHRLHGGQSDTIGLWCRLFDPVERAAHTAKAVAPQQF